MKTSWTLYAVRITRKDGSVAMLGDPSDDFVPEMWPREIAERNAEANRKNETTASAEVVEVVCRVGAVVAAGQLFAA